MRRLWIAPGVILLLLAGCGPARRAVRSEADTARTTAAAAHTGTAATGVARTAAETVRDEDTETVTEIVEFDTALPPDPATGTPPVKRKMRQVARTAARSQEALVSRNETRTATATDRAVETTEQTALRTAERNRRGMNGFQRLLCAAGLALLAGLVLRWALGRLKR